MGRRLLEALTALAVFPLIVFYRTRLVAFETISQLLAFVPGIAGVGVRRAWYERTLASCGARLVVDFMGAIRTPKAKVGNHCYIGRANWVANVDMGDDVIAGNCVTIHSGPHQHGFTRKDVPMRLQPGHYQQLRIGADVWLGSHVVVNADIAPGTIVASGSVVTKTFPAYSIIGGVPARVIRNRFADDGEGEGAG
jgi:acetyltransferase-like isoleucine patch superfamily enzyme